MSWRAPPVGGAWEGAFARAVSPTTCVRIALENFRGRRMARVEIFRCIDRNAPHDTTDPWTDEDLRAVGVVSLEGAEALDVAASLTSFATGGFP